MKKYTHEMLDDFTRDGLYLTIDQLQAELDKKSVPSGNGMTVEEIESMVHKCWFTWMDIEDWIHDQGHHASQRQDCGPLHDCPEATSYQGGESEDENGNDSGVGAGLATTDKGAKMKKITREEGRVMTMSELLDHVEALQAELDKKSVPLGNGVAVDIEELDRIISKHSDGNIGKGSPVSVAIAKAIQPLTVAQAPTVQAFQPDWSKAPDWVTGCRVFWYPQIEPHADHIAIIPRPPKVTRERTREEKIHAIKYYLQTPVVRGFEPMSDKLIDDLCTAAGISLTEEV